MGAAEMTEAERKKLKVQEVRIITVIRLPPRTSGVAGRVCPGCD